MAPPVTAVTLSLAVTSLHATSTSNSTFDPMGDGAADRAHVNGPSPIKSQNAREAYRGWHWPNLESWDAHFVRV